MNNLLIADSTVKSILKIGGITLLVCVALIALIIIIMPKKTLKLLVQKIKSFFDTHKTFAEILRFVIVGGIATIVDMFMMGVAMWLLERDIYPSFLNVFVNTPDPATYATVIGTAVGFISGLIVNYLLSIFFVFNEKGDSKTARGFIIFAGLSFIGLLINMGGMYLGYDVLNLNQWLVKVIMTIIVLIYNYISRKLILFKKKPQEKEEKSNQ